VIPYLKEQAQFVVGADEGKADFASPHASRLSDTKAAPFELCYRLGEASVAAQEANVVNAFALFSRNSLNTPVPCTGSTISHMMFAE